MMVLALALHLDPVYVGAHHLARFLVVTFSVAAGARWIGGQKSAAKDVSGYSRESGNPELGSPFGRDERDR
jgi:hypothetical protein